MHYKNVQKNILQDRHKNRVSFSQYENIIPQITKIHRAQQSYVQLLQHINRINKAEYRWKPIMHAVITNTAVVNLKLRLNEVL